MQFAWVQPSCWVMQGASTQTPRSAGARDVQGKLYRGEQHRPTLKARPSVPVSYTHCPT